jgi:hypothetical protein
MGTVLTRRLLPSLLVLPLTVGIARAADPLPSWRDTAPKPAIVAFVEQVTREGSRGGKRGSLEGGVPVGAAAPAHE